MKGEPERLPSFTFSTQWWTTCRVIKDNTLRVVPAAGDWKGIFDKAHSGTLGGHLRETKHGQVAKHYWWPLN